MKWAQHLCHVILPLTMWYRNRFVSLFTNEYRYHGLNFHPYPSSMPCEFCFQSDTQFYSRNGLINNLIGWKLMLNFFFLKKGLIPLSVPFIIYRLLIEKLLTDSEECRLHRLAGWSWPVLNANANKVVISRVKALRLLRWTAPLWTYCNSTSGKKKISFDEHIPDLSIPFSPNWSF